MKDMDTKIYEGLEGVCVAATHLSEVDGQQGRLTLVGYPVEIASRTLSFEQICAELWSAALDKQVPASDVVSVLQSERQRARRMAEKIAAAFNFSDGMDALRTSLSFVDITGLDDLQSAARLVACTGTFAAAWWTLRKNGRISLPDQVSDSHAEDYLRWCTGKSSLSDSLIKGTNAYFVTVSDHGMNASTFTARVIGSTGSDLVSACVGAIGALKGPLHGGAPGPVLDMLQAIGSPSAAVTWLEGEIAGGRRIMGMGHRIYRVRDPRAHALESAIETIEKSGITTPSLGLARSVEHAAREVLRRRYPNRSLEANVEFYTAVLLDIVGLDRRQFSPTFASSRVAGWCAHYFEQRRTGRLIRPESLYVGKKA